MTAAFVNIWQTRVGAVVWDDRSGYATFEYDPVFKSKGWDIAPLTMPIGARSNIFSFPALRRQTNAEFDTFKGLPGLLADALPDRYGSELIKLWLAQQGRSADSMNPVEMLCFMGQRGMGALEFEPTILGETKRAFSFELDSLVNTARAMLTQRKAFLTNVKHEEEKAILDILRIGTSAGGARPKAVIAYNEKTGDVKSGQTNAPKGYEHWLIKLDGVSNVQLGATKGFGRVEMAYYLMAIDCGIEMMPSRLLEENGRAHFMTKRFDREGGSTKHHFQTFCAMKHFDFNLVQSFSYEQLFQTLRELQLPYSAKEQVFRRMVFNVVARNCDDHTKNFAFLLRQGKTWELAPAYDMCHAYQPKHRWVSQHALSIQGKRTDINKEDLLSIGKAIQFKHAAQVIDEVQDVVSKWKKYAKEVGVAPKLRTAIEETLVTLR
jgi:serine/threonine-protein kinase HipA